MNTTAIGSSLFAWLLLLLFSHQSGSVQLLDESCGIRAPMVGTRIINGSIASLTAFPWMVFLHSTDDRFICGGTLITRRLVLTAAHCFLPNVELVARLGEYQRSKKEECYSTASGVYCTMREEHHVDIGIKHRLYDPTTHINDIAILRLVTPVVYKDNIRPICILLYPDRRWKNYIDSINPLVAAGWGKSEDERDTDYLMTLNIERQDPEICTEFIKATALGSSLFCAGNIDGNLCNGDSGGPLGSLVQIGKKKRFAQIGIASFTNRQCALASAFTDVLSHADWILMVARRYGNGQPGPSSRAGQSRNRQVHRRQGRVQRSLLPTTWYRNL